MDFMETLKGVVIAFIGAILIFLAIGIMAFQPFLKMYGFPDLGVLSLPLAIISLIFGLALVIYGQKIAGIT